MQQVHPNKLLGLGLLLALVTVVLSVERGGRRVQTNDFYANFKSPCGNSEQVAKRVGTCLVELFELLEGRFEQPQGDADVVGHCGRFNATERCARSVAKDCLSGLHKTAAGAVASATRRFRLQECKNVATRGKFIDPLKCAIRRGPEMAALYKNSTGVMQAIRDLNIEPEVKLMKMCCLLDHIDREIVKIFDRDCPKSTSVVLGIVNAVTDDARNTLCVAPKCNGALDKVLGAKYKPSQTFIEPVMQILFQLSVN